MEIITNNIWTIVAFAGGVGGGYALCCIMTMSRIQALEEEVGQLYTRLFNMYRDMEKKKGDLWKSSSEQ